MSVIVNKSAKKFLIQLTFLLFLGTMLIQIMVYMNAVYFKKAIVAHDYEIAGYLSYQYPELVYEIREAFTANKSSHHLNIGKTLLEQSGYKKSLQLYLIPQVSTFYKINSIIYFIFSILFSFIIVMIAYLHLKNHYKKIDRYVNTVNNIINGKIPIKLDDNEEGSISKLAASINMMTASLYAHIQKEKQDRIFLKNILTNVSHQLKTPLSALIMYTEIMKNENADNEVIARFLEKSEYELERIQALITNLLKLAKLDAGIIKLNKDYHILNDIIERVVESFETRLLKEQKTFEIISNGKVSYCCDKEWIFEAVSNLFKNAVEHTVSGDHIKVLIEETPLITKIVVEDNGEGIHPDDLNHIFKRFYRSKLSQNKQGTGIGLSVAKTIIEMHEGFISVESMVKKGTKFTVHLPNLQNCKI